MRAVEPPVCVALDTPDLDEAVGLVDALAGVVPVFKVGATLFTSAGPEAVAVVKARGADVFLDAKLADIPRQVAGATAAAAALGAGYLTVHAGAGRATVRAAVDAATGTGLLVLVVSVLTSLDASDLSELGVARSVSDQVDAMAALAVSEGARGLVCGAGEIARVRAAHRDLFLLMPGARDAATGMADQKRVGGAATAVRDGADMVVLGRVVTDAPDPVAATKRILAEIDEARTATRS